MALSPLDKQTAGCNSPHDWLMSLAMDYLLCVICGGENGINGCHLADFTVDVAFDFKATHPPHNLSPYKIGSGIVYGCKKLSKMVANSASYPLNVW